MSLPLLSTLFLVLAGLMSLAVLGLLCRYLESRTRVLASVVFLVWLLYVGILGYNGILANKVPPGPAFVLIPVLVFLAAFLARDPGVKAFAYRVPVGLLIGLQVFRVFVELALFALYQNRLIPRLMTFEGGNLDILIGLSAPIVAWLYVSRRINDSAVRVWTVFGILTLTNIVARTLLTFSGVVKTEIPNSGIGLFPFTFLPSFLAPLALYLHVLVLRSLPRELGGGRHPRHAGPIRGA